VEKKKHHYVPVTYLSRFTDDEGFLSVARKTIPSKLIRARPAGVAFRRFYYSQPLPTGGHDNNRLEDMFASFEADWRELSELLIQRQPANHYLKQLMGFIGFQRLRVPAFREAIEQAMANYAMAGLRELERRGELPPPPEEYPNIVNDTVITIDPHQSIHAIAQLLRLLGPFLDSLGYVVVENECDIEFITSDNPVSYFSSGTSDLAIRPYAVRRDRPAELIFPIGPKTLVYGASADRERFRSRGLKYVRWRDPNRVRRVNRIIARFAYEAVFSRTSLPPSFLLAHGVESPILEPGFPGFDPDHVVMPPFAFGTRTRLHKWDRNKDYDRSAFNEQRNSSDVGV
jgi:hypothetical protein